VALLRTAVAEERITSIIRVKRFDDLGTMLAVTSVISQKTAFFIVTAVNTTKPYTFFIVFTRVLH
jgi:hypothetical protein